MAEALNEELVAIVRPKMAENEEVKWVGKPSEEVIGTHSYAISGAVGIVFGGIVWGFLGKFSTAWLADIGHLVQLVVICLGSAVVFILLTGAWASSEAAKIYAITNKRLIVATPVQDSYEYEIFEAKSITTAEPSDDNNTLTITTENEGNGGGITINGLNNAKTLAEMLRAMKA